MIRCAKTGQDMPETMEEAIVLLMGEIERMTDEDYGFDEVTEARMEACRELLDKQKA